MGRFAIPKLFVARRAIKPRLKSFFIGSVSKEAAQRRSSCGFGGIHMPCCDGQAGPGRHCWNVPLCRGDEISDQIPGYSDGNELVQREQGQQDKRQDNRRTAARRSFAWTNFWFCESQRD